MRSILVTLAILDFVLFGLALRTLFGRVPRTPVLTRTMVIVGTAFGGVHTLVLATWPLHHVGAWIASALYVAAGALFCWTACCVRGKSFRLAYCHGGPSYVVSNGPYRWVRHPLYLSYTLAWFAAVVATGAMALLWTVGVMLAFYVGAAFGEERRMLHGPAADQYRAYRRHAGIVVPRFWSFE